MMFGSMENGHVMSAFFKNIPNRLLISFGQMGRINCGVFPVELSAHYVFLVHDYQSINHYFYKKQQDILGFGYEFGLQKIKDSANLCP